MTECARKYGVDVYMDDQGYYRAECADCEWKSGRCFSEGEANQAASKHMSTDIQTHATEGDA